MSSAQTTTNSATRPTIYCPLPDVEVALAPYIRTRAEALRIRQVLTAYLLSQVSSSTGDHHEITNLELINPSADLIVSSIPSEVSGLRLQYLSALQARSLARQRRDALQVEINELRAQYAAQNTRQQREEELQDIAEGYTTLLSTRQRHAKLQIIDRAVDDLLAAQPDLVHTDLATLIESKVGVSPDPPTVSLNGESKDARTEELRFRLKRQVLLAKQNADKARDAKERALKEAGRKGPLNSEEEVAQLRQARDELVAWIEGELAKIGEDSTMLGESPRKQAPKEEEVNLDELYERVKVQYEVYLENRTSLVAAVDQLSSTTARCVHAASEKSLSSDAISSLSLAQSKPPLQASDLVHTIKPLIQMSRTETDLQQQLSYLRRQLTTASEDAFNTLRRLADESHMVPPRSDNVDAWVQAAKESEKETKAEVDKSLVEGEKSVEEAREILEKLRMRNENFKRIKGTL